MINDQPRAISSLSSEDEIDSGSVLAPRSSEHRSHKQRNPDTVLVSDQDARMGIAAC